METKHGIRLSGMILIAALGLLLAVAGCTAPPRPAADILAAPALPTPAAVADATLVYLRQLTTSGGATLGAWSPDGQTLVYAEGERPALPMQLLGQLPKMLTKQTRLDGSDATVLEEGVPLFFSPDGETLYLSRELAAENLDGLWALNLADGSLRRVADGSMGQVAHQLDDGRVVLSDRGTYAPLRVYDPTSGALADLTGPFPSNSPEDARVSPDGTRLAYPQMQEVYLANADGSHARPLSQDGGFSAQVWWSPDSQLLAYTTGGNWTDRLLLADREGRTVATLVPALRDFGWVSQVAWSPDAQRLLVLSQAYFDQPPRPDRLYLFDTAGNSQLLLEAYLHNVAWSPDGRRIALSRWDGPLGGLATDDVWLTELTDRAALASLPAATAALAPTATPVLPLPPAYMTPEEVIGRFWAALNTGDYLTAYAATASDIRARQGLPYFSADWQCIQQAWVLEIAPMGEASETESRFTVQVNVQLKSGCDGWMRPGPFASLIRETPDGPWLIEGFFTGP